MSSQPTRVESIFLDALEKPTLRERAAYLDEVCACDPKLRQRVETLLRAQEDAGSFLEVPLVGGAKPAATGFHGSVESPFAGQPPASGPDSSSVDRSALDFLGPPKHPGHIGMLGPYEITELIGRGGMGIVLKGFDPRLHRFVAVKVLAPEAAGNPMARQRFLREARAAAAISHDHVVTFHDVDESDRLPFLVMEYINGVSLQDLLNRKGGLELKEILRIGMQAASGLAAAHAQGLVHRDIKPANILLENGVQRVKITDFGLARAVDEVAMTQTGVVTGTPLYMSPEQAHGEPIDHRADLFSLGSVLYAACTGRTPFRAETTMGVLRRVCDDTPRPIREINPEIPDWLCDIIDRLLEKDPDDRFQSAAEVADLLGLYLAYVQQPTQVTLPRPAGVPRRNRRGNIRRAAGGLLGERLRGVALLCVIAMLVMFVSGLSFTGEPWGIGFGFAERTGTLILDVKDPEITEIRLQPRDKRTRERFGQIWAHTFQLNRNRQLRLPNFPAPGLYQIDFRRGGPALYEDQAVEILAGKTRRVSVPMGSPPAQESFRQPTTPPRTFRGHDAPVNGVALAPDGRRAVTAGSDGMVRLWDLQTGQELRQMRGHADRINAVALSPDGRRALSGGKDGIVRLWDLETGKDLRALKAHRGWIYGLAFSPDGRHALSCGADWQSKSPDNSVRLWDLETGDEIRRLDGHTDATLSVAFSPDGQFAASAGFDQTVRIWDLETGDLVRRLDHPSRVYSVVFAPDGQHVLSGCGAVGDRDGWVDDPESCLIRLWNVETGRVVREFRGHSGCVASLAISTDGHSVVSGSRGEYFEAGQKVETPARDNSIRVWDVASGRELCRFPSQTSVLSVNIAAKGRTILSGHMDGAFRLWVMPE